MTDFETVAATELHTATPGRAGEPNAPGQPSDLTGARQKVRGLAGDAWLDLRRNPVFWVAAALVVLVILMAVFPSFFARGVPTDCDLSRQHAGRTGGALFGYDFQGCDVWARAVYGTRASLFIGGLAALVSLIISVIVGMVAGYFGGWADALLSRVTDIVLGIPLLLAAIVLMTRVGGDDTFRKLAIVAVLAGLGWTTAARVIRSSVITARQQDYVAAARMLGAGNGRIMWRHILPNSLAPVVVVITIALGAFIATEATLSYLGIGLQSTVSWGVDINAAQVHQRESVIPLVVPSVFLALTVLAFIMLGDAIRDAFDPKLR